MCTVALFYSCEVLLISSVCRFFRQLLHKTQEKKNRLFFYKTFEHLKDKTSSYILYINLQYIMIVQSGSLFCLCLILQIVKYFNKQKKSSADYQEKYQSSPKNNKIKIKLKKSSLYVIIRYQVFSSFCDCFFFSFLFCWFFES